MPKKKPDNLEKMYKFLERQKLSKLTKEIKNLNSPIFTKTSLDSFIDNFYQIFKEEIIFLHKLSENRRKEYTRHHFIKSALS